MSHQMFHDVREDGRSVLGRMAVQVERDPKTGATVVRSVAPISEPTGAAAAAPAVFDDGRMSIHAVGGSAAQPSSEELGQILSVIDGVGMKVILDEVTVTPGRADAKTEDDVIVKHGSKAPIANIPPAISPYAASKVENVAWPDKLRSERLEVPAAPVAEKQTTAVVTDVAQQVEHIEEQRLEEGPVTLMFLGYDEGEGDAQEDEGGVITVERVMITDDGEEHVLGPQLTDAELPGKSVEGKSPDFHDVPLEENGGGAKAQGGGGDKGLQEPSLPAVAAAVAKEDGETKRKTCKCCSVM
ncbi:unnamed protein product [Ophioblennius macclurei]